jgi:CheY-like chemotaxis protein
MNNWRAKHALVLEDEGMIASMIEDMLIELGHRVAATAGTVQKALTFLSGNECDLAVLDVNLGGDGNLRISRPYQVAELLAARKIPFIFATGYGSPGISPEWAQVPVIQKPFDGTGLRRVLEQARSRDRVRDTA